MNPMRTVILSSSLVLGLAAVLPASAKTISVTNHSPTQVKRACGKSGGIYLPKKEGVYGCINDDGGGIVCGGKTPKHKKTCDTFRVAPGTTELPKRPLATERSP